MPDPAGPDPAAVAAAVLTDTTIDLRPPLVGRRTRGGYSWWTYTIRDVDDVWVVVRVAPPGGTMAPNEPAAEARAIAAGARAVPAPDVLAVVETPNALGAPYAVHGHVPGTVHRLSHVPEGERDRYRRRFAAALGELHRFGDVAAFGSAPPANVTDALRAGLEAAVADFARGARCRHPGFTVGVRWLLTHLPASDESPTLCHGDYRFHNVAWTPDAEIAGVLDWERAWVGDPMVDVAFTRRFSGWCAVDGDVVSVYEDRAGRPVDEVRVAYGERFEHIRSFTSSARGGRALGDGLVDDLALYAIGESGDVGAWALVDLLSEGSLVPAPDDDLPTAFSPLVPPARLAALASSADRAGDTATAGHLRRSEAVDRRTLAASVEQLRTCPPPRGRERAWTAAMARGGDAAVWSAAYEILAEACVDGGPDLVPALRALGRRFTDRPTLRPASARPAARSAAV